MESGAKKEKIWYTSPEIIVVIFSVVIMIIFLVGFYLFIASSPQSDSKTSLSPEEKDPNSLSDLGSIPSDLQQVAGTKVSSISSKPVSPTPKPIKTPTPTSAPSQTPTQTPTPIPELTVTPTPTSSPESTSTPTPTFTPTDTPSPTPTFTPTPTP